VAAWNPSVGQDVLDPVHVSATSHAPADARHTVPALPALWSHVMVLPCLVQMSVVQGWPSSRQVAPTPRAVKVVVLVAGWHDSQSTDGLNAPEA
jgi:hypothetical protein